MMITYYCFPDSLSLEERISAYLAASGVKLDMTDRFDRCRHQTISENIGNGGIAVSITIAKKLLRSIGGKQKRTTSSATAQSLRLRLFDWWEITLATNTTGIYKAGDSMITACLLIALFLYIEK